MALRKGSQRGIAGALMPFHALILTLLAPPLAGVQLLFLMGARPFDLSLVASMLAPVYFIGAAPAFLAGRLDAMLASSGWSVARRLAAIAAIGGAAGGVILAPLYIAGMMHGALPLLFPLVLAFSASLALGFNMVLVRIIAANVRRFLWGTSHDEHEN